MYLIDHNLKEPIFVSFVIHFIHEFKVAQILLLKHQTFETLHIFQLLNLNIFLLNIRWFEIRFSRIIKYKNCILNDIYKNIIIFSIG